jgi:predicted ATPase
MKIRSVTLQNYRRFSLLQTFSFLDTEKEVNNQTLLIGNNGSGKTTLLQAIVSVIAPLVREDTTPATIDWNGYEYRLIKNGVFPFKCEVEVEFTENEIQATTEYAQKLIQQGVKLNLPGELRVVKLTLDYDGNKISPGKNLPVKTLFQFSGYQYAKRLASMTPNKSILFNDVGNIYWYTENRTSTSITNLFDENLPSLDQLRQFLASAYNYHQAVADGRRELKPGEFDFYDKLQTVYKIIFPDRSFVGPTPRFDIFENAPSPDFFLFDGHNHYEISGMSAGERAVFPILMDFARWNINNSIIIIDEVELHLHPPLQQTLISALHKLGNNNQFILTSHSNYVANQFDESENQIIRLPNE